MTSATEIRLWVTYSIIGSSVLLAIMLWGRRILAMLFFAWLLVLPTVALADCRMVTIFGPDGKAQTCQVCDHIVNCF